MTTKRRVPRSRSTAEIHADYRRYRLEYHRAFVEMAKASLILGDVEAEEAFEPRLDELNRKHRELVTEAIQRSHATVEDMALLAEIALECTNYDLDGVLLAIDADTIGTRVLAHLLYAMAKQFNIVMCAEHLPSERRAHGEARMRELLRAPLA